MPPLPPRKNHSEIRRVPFRLDFIRWVDLETACWLTWIAPSKAPIGPLFFLRYSLYEVRPLTTATPDHPERNFEDIGTEALALRRAGEHGDDHIADCVLRHQNPNLDSGLRGTNQKLG